MKSHATMRSALPLALLAALGTGACSIMPEPLTIDELSQIGHNRLGAIAADQEPLPRTVDLHEAIARAVKYNLDHEVEIAEHAVRRTELDLAHYSLLPNVVASSGYAGRDKFNASNSVNVLTGVESLATSTSQDKTIRTADIAFSWNILDFGLSYIRARQAADKVLIQNELRRKILLRVIEDTRSAYWRAATAQRLMGRLKAIEAEAKAVESEARRMGRDGETSAITALTYEREIVEIQRTLGELQRSFNTAKAQLAALMSVRPDTSFTLVVPSHPAPPAVLGGGFEHYIQTALVSRPELREVEYRKRINAQEAHAALVELLPGVTQVVGANFDSNSFLLNSDWLSWGTKATWNLVKVFSYPARKAVVDSQEDMLEARGLAVTMAVVTQVYVSRIRHAHALKEFNTAEKYRAVQQRLLAQMLAEADAGQISRQTIVREKLNGLVAEAKRDYALSEVHTAYANMLASIGVDLVGEIDRDRSVKELAGTLRSHGPFIR